jgi:hypothetical protein
MYTGIISEINQLLEIKLPVIISSEELRQQLINHINYLINHDFEKLVYYLYRIDVDEQKMKAVLDKVAGENAALLITDLIIDRLQEKAQSRKQFTFRDKKDIDENEKW